MTALDFANNNSFTAWSMKHLSITEDEQGNVIVSCPDKDGRWYHVTCQESKTNITPVSCSCGHENCAHMQITEVFYARIFKSNIEKEAAKKVATPVVVEQFDGSRPLTTEEWKAIIKRDKIRQRQEKVVNDLKLPQVLP